MVKVSFSKLGLALSVAAFSVVPSSSLAAKRDSDAPNMLTHGMVQMTLVPGQTTQLQILETFGAPNVTTIEGPNREVWIYDRHATVTSASGSGFSIGMLLGGAGGDGGGAAGVGFGSRKSRAEQSSRSMTIIIKFDENKRVVDFRSRASSF
ncbi:hypothetical protein FMM06_05505 [Glacieibacterium frigidum]|uniref:Lipoprotein SmpA/OmlA domain-containing protein n=2 Tax=Glacieibacterium frigidum TaxID=2593303 RepID=A0A552UJR2_9SPHN|nr:hypothetical protein FMM06_05505 [Glacieibacterium frigidum]